MLTARATAEAIRAVYPACLSGIITEDEAVEIAEAAAPTPAPVVIEPVTLTVIPEPTRRPRKSRNGTTPEPVAEPQNDKNAVPEAEPAQPKEAVFAPEPEATRPSPNSSAFYHPLDEHLASLNQEKLSAFLLRQGFIQPGQSYKWCGPNATSRILKQMGSFLKAAGFEEELVS
jgi:hypothetical protein